MLIASLNRGYIERALKAAAPSFDGLHRDVAGQDSVAKGAVQRLRLRSTD